MKVVINKCYGGFELSKLAQERFAELTGQHLPDFEIERDDPALVQVVEELGKAASGNFAQLKVVTLPDGTEWEIQEYDGVEWLTQPLINLEDKYTDLQPKN